MSYFGKVIATQTTLVIIVQLELWSPQRSNPFRSIVSILRGALLKQSRIGQLEIDEKKLTQSMNCDRQV